MIRFKAEHRDTKQPIFGLGLSFKNLALLTTGHPITIDLTEMGGTGQVLLMYGETEQAMIDEPTKEGLLNKDIPVHDQKPVQPGEFDGK